MDINNMLISFAKKDYLEFNVEKYVKSKREELEKMIPGFSDKQLTNVVLNFYEKGIREGVKFGASKMKEQMMKDFPHWQKSNLPDDNSTSFNSDYFFYKWYNINYKELFEKLPKDD